MPPLAQTLIFIIARPPFNFLLAGPVLFQTLLLYFTRFKVASVDINFYAPLWGSSGRRKTGGKFFMARVLNFSAVGISVSTHYVPLKVVNALGYA